MRKPDVRMFLQIYAAPWDRNKPDDIATEEENFKWWLGQAFPSQMDDAEAREVIKTELREALNRIAKSLGGGGAIPIVDAAAAKLPRAMSLRMD